MNLLRRLLVWRGHRHTRFDDVLPSSLPGADFTAKFTARWAKKHDGAPRTASFIRAQLRDQAREITRHCSVLRVDAARDLVLAKIAKTKICGEDGNEEPCEIIVHADIRLGVDPGSRRIAEQHNTHLRELQVSRDAEHASLLSLRDNVFADSALAKIWWIRQYPEHATAVGKDGKNVLDEIRTESAAARSHSNTQPDQDGLTAIIIEFMRWLSTNEETRRLALETFYRLLEKIGPPESNLPARLRSLSPDLQLQAAPSDGETALTFSADQPARNQ